MKPSHFTYKHELLFCFLIAIAIASIYAQVLNHEFVSYDDLQTIVNNPYVTQGLTGEGLKWAFGYQNKVETWHPITWLLHMVNYELFGNRSGLHLLMNVFWHMVNTFLLFFLFHRTTNKFWPSVIVASLFAVHPINVESVAWVSELKNVFSTFFLMLSLMAYMFYTQSPNVKRYLLLVVIFIAGILAKPMLVTLPCVLLLLDYWPLKRITFPFSATEEHKPISASSVHRLITLVLEKIPLFCISIIAWYTVSKSLGDLDNIIPFSKVPLSLRVENLFVSYVSYLSKSLWPVDLVFYYPFPKSLPIAQVLFSILLLGIITFVFLVPLRKRTHLSVGWLWFLGTLVPVSGLIQAGLWASMANRYAYVPFIGLFIIYAWCVNEFFDRQGYRGSLLSLVTVLMVFIYGTVSWHQVKHWKNDETLFGHAVRVSSDNSVALNNYGVVLNKKGQPDEAAKHFYQALDIDPTYVKARQNLIDVLNSQGKIKEAIGVYDEGILLMPNSFKGSSPKVVNDIQSRNGREEEATGLKQRPKPDPKKSDTYFRMAQELTRLGRFEEAIENYHTVVDMDPDHIESLNNLAMLYDQLNDEDSAILYFRKALAVDPHNPEINYNLAYSLSAAGNVSEAEKYFTKALDVNPAFIGAHINLGILLAQSARTEEAMSHFAKALQLDPTSIDGHSNMGIILYKLGRKEEAVFHFKEALQFDPDNQYLNSLLDKAQGKRSF